MIRRTASRAGRTPAAAPESTAGVAARGGDRGTVAVTILLLLVLGSTGAAPGDVPSTQGRALAAGIALQELAVASLARSPERPRPAAAAPARVRPAVRALPRAQRVDGHAWPPARAPGG